MTRRVYIGNSGGSFLFRASQPGIDAVSGDLTRMATFEGLTPMVPKAQGTVSVGPGSVGSGGAQHPTSVTVSVGATFSYPPFVLIKCTDGSIVGEGSVWAVFDADSNTIKISNLYAGTKTVKWFAFAEL